MKHLRLTLLLITLLFWQTSQAQTNYRFADSTAQWNVLYTDVCWGHCVHINTVIHYVKGDTMLNQQHYQVITPSALTSEYYLRADSTGRVFGTSSTDSVEHLLYNFSLGKGDTLTVTGLFPYALPLLCHIDSTDTLYWETPRVVQYVSSNYGNDVWIQGVGALHTYFLTPGNDPSAIDCENQDLLCYFENDSLLLHDTANYFLRYVTDTGSCDITYSWTGITAPGTSTIKVTPNPVTDGTFTLNLPQQPIANTQLLLYNAAGKLVSQTAITEAQQTLSAPYLAWGIYFYAVKTGSHTWHTGKLLWQTGKP